jgi:TPR repeat protein
MFHYIIVASTREPPDRERVLVDLKDQFTSDDISNALNGDNIVSLRIGKAYLLDSTISKQLLKAFQWIQRSAEQGNMEAEFLLAELYSLGHGTSQDSAKAFEWYIKSALQGYHEALDKIHHLYHQNNMFEHIIDTRLRSETSKEKERVMLSGIKQYFSTQLDLHQHSDPDDRVIHGRLGFMYQHGYSVKKSRLKAMECYGKAAENDLAGAQLNLGILYQTSQQNKYRYETASF